MELWSLALIALGVSADAFAVALCRGVQTRRRVLANAVVVGVAFGVFQALMPLIGWLIGTQFHALIENVDHWIAFALLAAIGGKLIWDAFHPSAEQLLPRQGFRIRQLLALAFATSLDALAVGVSFAFVDVPIIPAVALIGVTTAVLSAAGVFIGHKAGIRFRRPAEIIGGLVLIGIGTKVLLEHLGVL